MQKFYKPARMALIFIVMATFLTIYVSALYKMQIYDARPSEDELYPQKTSTRTVALAAARGNIYDRNGILLASNKPSYNITLSWKVLKSSPNMNEIIQTLIYAAAKNNVKYNDTFPITRGAPFAYLSDMSAPQRNRLDKYIECFKDKGLKPEMSASDLFNWMKKQYSIDYTTGISDARLIIGVRYELETRVLGITTTSYVFAEDVGAEFAAFIEEQGLPGVYIETSSVREYHTSYAAHVIGYTARLDGEDYEKFTELGYPGDARVGKAGAELAFEEYLHGVDGKMDVTTSETGAVVGMKTTEEPEPGDNVYLTLDIGLQMVAEDALNTHIDTLNFERAENERVTGGAVVVTDVKTGAALAIASAPTFDLSTLAQNIVQLNNDDSRPMWNRAARGRYNPGSTFKMVTALAGLRTGAIGRWTQIDDTGVFTKYESYQPRCWYYSLTGFGHGLLDVVGALECSCNYFFYQVGFVTGFRPIANAAFDFGFGQKTGIEIQENTGAVATSEYKQEVLGEGWKDGDTLLSAIGQSHNYFTPLQLANYTATIANGGTRYNLSILNKVKSADFSELLYTYEPVVANVIEETDYIRILQEGMRAVARTGTAASVFSNYREPVAAKTGTVQSDASKIDDGVFVCYAPADDPEIAIAIVIEKGKSGSAVMEIARSVLDYYFSSEALVSIIPEGGLIP